MSLRRTLCFALALLLLSLAFGPTLVRHIQQARNPAIFNDDARQQIAPLTRLHEHAGGPTNTLGDYALDLIPPLYKLAMRAIAPFAPPVAVSKWLPYVLFAVLLAAQAWTAWRLGGALAGFFTVVLTFSTSAFLARLVGGLPRSFGLPGTALACALLAGGRVHALAALTVVLSGLYAAVAAVVGLALATLLLVVPADDRGTAATWSLRKRLGFLAGTAALCALVLAPTVISSASWGRALGPGDASLYPEIGDGGRYGLEDRVDGRNLIDTSLREATKALRGSGRPFVAAALRNLGWANEGKLVAAALGIIALGWLLLAARSGAARRLLALPIAASGGFLLAELLAPHLYLPQRYVSHTLPVLLVVMLPVACGAIGERVGPSRSHLGRTLAIVAGCLLWLSLLGARGDPDAGYVVRIDPDAKLLPAIAALDPNALIAGFPGGPIEDVPYVTGRRALLTREMHQAFHEGYVLEMRRRATPLFAALLSDDDGALLRLRDELGVTHLIVDEGHFLRRPIYFKPFDEEIVRCWNRGRANGFAAERAAESATVLREGGYVLLDLGLLPARDSRRDSP